MLIYIFDVDDTLIFHNKDHHNYYTMETPDDFKNLLEQIPSDYNFIYTNGTYGHGDSVIKNMNLQGNITKIFARDTIPYKYPVNMKPSFHSLAYVNQEIKKITGESIHQCFFFDDMIKNLETAKVFGWITILIHPEFINYKNIPYIDYTFPNIYQALIYFLLIK
jgi:FMN phosphatase YigB (HAD superfamily)